MKRKKDNFEFLYGNACKGLVGCCEATIFDFNIVVSLSALHGCVARGKAHSQRSRIFAPCIKLSFFRHNASLIVICKLQLLWQVL